MSEHQTPEPSTFEFAPGPPNTFEFAPGTPMGLKIQGGLVAAGFLLKIWPDGRIERGPAFTTLDEASLAFWRILGETYPRYRAMVRAEDSA